MLPFDLPAPMGFKDQPKWNGNEFELGEIRLPVLEYSENFIGWSDDLTALHEDALGSSHPIDVASRKMAIKAVTKEKLPPFVMKEILKREFRLLSLGITFAFESFSSILTSSARALLVKPP